jgi:hypothetical protein
MFNQGMSFVCHVGCTFAPAARLERALFGLDIGAALQ